MDFKNYPYAKFLEDAVRYIFETNPEKLALVASAPNGETLTAYYQADAQDKAVFAHHIYSDAMMDIMLCNIGLIKEALDEYEEENGE